MKNDINLHLQQLLDLDSEVEQIKAVNQKDLSELHAVFEKKEQETTAAINEFKSNAQSIKQNAIDSANKKAEGIYAQAKEKLEACDNAFNKEKSDIVNQLYTALFEA